MPVRSQLLKMSFRNANWPAHHWPCYALAMELYQQRTFVVVAAEQSVTRAARRLFTTPPSISGHIKALEDEWNVILFRRTTSGMEITEKGRELRAKAEATLLAAQDLSNHATDLQDYLLGTIAIGVNCALDRLHVPQLIERMRTACPGVDLRIVQGASGRIAEDIERESLDAGFIFGPGLPALITHRLATVDLLVVAPTEWRSKLLGASWAAVAELPWIHSGGLCPFQVMIDEIFAARGLVQRKGVSADDDHTRVELVSAGMGLALLEKSDALRAVETGHAFVWPCESIQSNLSFAYLAARKNDPLIRALRMAVASEWELVTDVVREIKPLRA